MIVARWGILGVVAALAALRLAEQASNVGELAPLEQAVTANPDDHQARFDLATGTCKLFRLSDDSERELASQPTTVRGPGSYRLRFADFDDRLTVWVGDSLPFGDGIVFDPPKDKGPRKENDLERPASVGVQNAAVRVNHLQVWRDTYYTMSVNGPDATLDKKEYWAEPKEWGPLRKIGFRTLYVQPGHYLCMGDNSPESSDGLTWGLVPDRLLLGRALLVYWPANRAGRIR